MTPEFQYALTWMAGSLVGYLLSRMVWRRFVVREIGFDDNIFLTLAALVLSWFLVAGSVISLLIHALMSGIDDSEAYWQGKTGAEIMEDEERRRSGDDGDSKN